MKVRLIAAALLGLGWSLLAPAEELTPGLWEISLELQLPGAAPQTALPTRVSQCLSAADARDPSKILGAMATPGASDCRYVDKTDSGNAFHFSMECAGTYQLKLRGDLVHSSTSMSGSIVTHAQIGGQAVELPSRVSARRLGDC